MITDLNREQENMYRFYLDNTYVATAAEVEKMGFTHRVMRARNSNPPLYYVGFYYLTAAELCEAGVTPEKLSSMGIPKEFLSGDYTIVVQYPFTTEELKECGKSRKQFEREYRPKRFPVGYIL